MICPRAQSVKWAQGYERAHIWPARVLTRHYLLVHTSRPRPLVFVDYKLSIKLITNIVIDLIEYLIGLISYIIDLSDNCFFFCLHNTVWNFLATLQYLLCLLSSDLEVNVKLPIKLQLKEISQSWFLNSNFSSLEYSNKFSNSSLLDNFFFTNLTIFSLFLSLLACLLLACNEFKKRKPANYKSVSGPSDFNLSSPLGILTNLIISHWMTLWPTEFILQLRRWFLALHIFYKL